MKDFCISSIQDLEYLSRDFGVGTISVKVKNKQVSENTKWETRLNNAVRACGCFESGAAFLLTLMYILYNSLWQESDLPLMSNALSNLVLLVCALVIGKLLGFLRVQIYRHIVIANAKAWINS